VKSLARIAHPDHRCAFGIAVRKCIDQQRLPHAEDRARRANADRDRTDGDGRKPFLSVQEAKGQPKILSEDLDVLSGCVRDDCRERTDRAEQTQRVVRFTAESVDEDERHLLTVLVAICRRVEVQGRAEHDTRAPFETSEGHGYRLRGTRPLALASASRRMSLAASDLATRRPNGVRR
jgi:hypothetical protein